jgi:hypothetical protein
MKNELWEFSVSWRSQLVRASLSSLSAKQLRAIDLQDVGVGAVSATRLVKVCSVAAVRGNTKV